MRVERLLIPKIRVEVYYQQEQKFLMIAMKTKYSPKWHLVKERRAICSKSFKNMEVQILRWENLNKREKCQNCLWMEKTEKELQGV